MSQIYVQKFYSHECQPSGHQLSHQTIAKLWHLMVGEGLRARMSAVVQLWSKTTTANLWLMTHRKIVCVITDGTDGQDLCFVRFYDHNLKTIYFEVDLNNDFVFETRSSVFYVLSGSYGQSIGIKFSDKLEAKDFKIIVMERLLKQFEQLSEYKPSNSNPRVSHRIPEPIRRHTFPNTLLSTKNMTAMSVNRSVIDLQLDPTLDTIIEQGLTRLLKGMQLMDSSLNQLILDVRHRRHTYQEVSGLMALKGFTSVDVMDVIDEHNNDQTLKMDSIAGFNSGNDIKLPESSLEVMAKFTVNGHELATDDHSDPIRDTEDIAIEDTNKDNSRRHGNVEEYDAFIGPWSTSDIVYVSQGYSFWPLNRRDTKKSRDVHKSWLRNRKSRVIRVDSITYKWFREVIGAKSLVRVYIRNDSLRSKLSDQLYDNPMVIRDITQPPVIWVNREVYKHIRYVVAMYGGVMSNYQVFITTDSIRSKNKKKLMAKSTVKDNILDQMSDINEISEDISHEYNDNQSDGRTDDNKFDVYLNLLSERKIKVSQGSNFWQYTHKATNESRDAHNGRKHRPKRRVIPVDSVTYNRFREVVGDLKCVYAFIANDSIRSKSGNKTNDGHSKHKDPVICVDSQMYKHMRDVLAIYGDMLSDHQVVIKMISKRSESSKQSGCKFGCC